MLGLYVRVPIACFRKGLAREYLETEPLPPPATCYGFLLSLVGEMDRRKHIGCRLAPVLLNKPATSVVLRTIWRVKDRNLFIDPTGHKHFVSTDPKKRKAFADWVSKQKWPAPEFRFGQGATTNARPDYQQLLSPVELAVWLDSSQEPGERLEERVRNAMSSPASVSRFGGLSLGESTHMVDDVCVLDSRRVGWLESQKLANGRAFLTAERGRLSLPVWVDHVGAAGTRYATGDLEAHTLQPPPVARMPLISPD